MQIGLGIGITFRRKWVPPLTEQIRSLLFGSGQQGAWYDPSDMSTLFQDAAGTTPVTAVEQPVGRILDKSGRDNHATQATTTKRPVLSRRVNVFTESEFRNGATDAPTRAGLVTGTTMSGYLGALAFGHNGTTTSYAYKQFTTVSGVPYIISVVVETTDGLPPVFGDLISSNTFALVFGGHAVSPSNHSVRELGGGRYRVTATAVGNGAFNCGVIKYGSNDARTFKVTAYDLRLVTDAHLPYQWVNTATDYDADPSKFPAYLRFDGVDDALQTGNIDFTSTDKMTVWAGVTKLSDAAAGTLLELSVNSFANNGTIGMFTPSVAAANNIFQRSRGTAQSTVAAAAIAPTSFIWTAASSINPPSLAARISGVQVAANTLSQGSGNYGNYPLYIGAAAGTSHFFNGRLYSLIVRGAQTPLSQIEATELYVKQKMRMP